MDSEAHGRGLPALKIAIADYGHTAAMLQGDVRIDGVQAEFVQVQPIISAFRRMVRDLEFDVCEMAPATYMIARAAGLPIKALPVFVFRRFHHEGLVVRADAGIRQPRDLEGRRVGVRAYSVTTGIWTRGILAEEYGLDIAKVTWVVDDEEHLPTLRLPPNVQRAPTDKSLVDMMGDGSLSAAFTGNAGIGRAGAPSAGWQASDGGDTPYLEMFADARAREADWFHRTGIYPIHGLVVVKQARLDAHPWLASALFDAFAAARNAYVTPMLAGAALSDKDAHYRAMAAIVGDPLPYGIAPNRPAIEALMRYGHAQGLLPRRYAVEDMFIEPGA
jgi:4,5-dihydroxyphthalate decarboxylase